LIIATGSLLPRTLAEQVRDTMCGRIVNTYGSTETGGVASAPVEALDLDNGEVGFVMPGVQADFVDPETHAPAKDGGGTLRIRGEAVAPGYFGNGEGSEAFEGDAFHTSDLGYLSLEGCLSIQGRNNNVINLSGDKITLERAEALYSAAPGVRELAAAVVTDRLGIHKVIAVIVPSGEWSEQAFRDHCERHVQRAFWPAKVLTVEMLPRSANGKLDRNKVNGIVGPIDSAAD